MRILKRDTPIGYSGFLHLIPDEEEDLYYIYNLLVVGDAIKAKSFRKVISISKTGSTNAQKKLLNLTLRIVSISYTPGDNIELMIKGKNIVENESIALGQSHTIKLELNMPIVILKNYWEKYHIDLIKECTDIAQTADVAAFVMDEGVAHLCYIKNNATYIKAKLEKNIPKKKSGSEYHDKVVKQFFEICFVALVNVDFDKIKGFIIASPGYIKDQFFDYIKEMSQKEEFQKIKQNLEKFLLVKSSNGYKDALNEALSDPKVLVKLKDTKAIKELKALEIFYETMKKDSDRIAYGPRHVIEANSHKAIDYLLLSDLLFRSKDFGKRKSYNELCEKVQEFGGHVMVFSSMHVSGEKLNNLSGIAAILRFPLNLDYLDEEEEKNVEEEVKTQEEDNDDKKEDVKIQNLLKEKNLMFGEDDDEKDFM